MSVDAKVTDPLDCGMTRVPRTTSHSTKIRTSTPQINERELTTAILLTKGDLGLDKQQIAKVTDITRGIDILNVWPKRQNERR